MSWPIRQKSCLNLLLQERLYQGVLELDQLITFPSQQIVKPDIRKLIQKNNRLGCKNLNEANNSQKIKVQGMYQKYYDSSMIMLKNCIEFRESKQYLKRYYLQRQYSGKIQSLGEYYKYHEDQPRIFISEVDQIITIYQQQKRDFQYQKVKQKIQQEKDNQKGVDSKKSTQTKNKTKKCQKLLKNIHLSYVDFQKKPKKIQKGQKGITDNKGKGVGNQNKKLGKTNSMSYKNILTKDVDLFKTKIVKKNDTHNHSSKNSINNPPVSKYSSVINQLFKKKRSSSKSNLILPKSHHKLNQKQAKHLSSKQQVQSCYKSANDQQNDKIDQNQKDDFQQNEEKKIVRSKSQANMIVCKSTKLLKVFKDQNRFFQKQKVEIKQNPVDPNQQINKKLQKQGPQKTMKKCQSTKSVTKTTSYNSNKNKYKIQQKKVKVFQINKKDLVLIHKEQDQLNKKQSVQKQQLSASKISKKRKSLIQKLRQKPLLVHHDNYMQKQNRVNSIEQDPKKRCISSKITTNLLQTNLLSKKPIQQQPKQRKKSIVSSMFDRVIRTKMR